MTIQEIIGKFNTTPFLFVGSGMTRRYLNLPDWKGLLKHFAEIIRDDEFAYDSYENQANGMDCKAGVMPKVAELIQKDFDQKWFCDASIRTVGSVELELIHNGLSPFKAELSNYIKQKNVLNMDYQTEISKFSEISEKSIAGVITTNYDSFLEDNFQGFSKYVGQSQLIFSSIQGVAEIYKIHGSVEVPSSIVINEDDYVRFQEKSAYLAAKLMTIFMEYPIIFMGYSISDSNIQNIIKSIVNCLDADQVKKLEDRFIFIEYKKDMVGAEVTPYTIMIDDTRIADEELVLAIGRASEIGLKGLRGLESNEWYRDIVLGDLDFSADELLEHAYPKLLKQNSGKVPANKHLAKATRDFPEYRELMKSQNFDSIISKTIKKHRNVLGSYTSVRQIWENEKGNLEKATGLIAYLTEEQMDLNELETILKELFEEDMNVLQNESKARTNIRRLIRIYDYLKWGK